jgi:hypothetical protein
VPFIVTGISQDGNITALEAALKTAGLALDAFDILGPEDAPAPVPAGGLVDTGILSGGLETGTGVPGLTGSGIPGITSGSLAAGMADGDSLWNRLSDLAIPDDEVDNYTEALEAGRSIVAYHASSANAAIVEDVFRSAGLRNVKTF